MKENMKLYGCTCCKKLFPLTEEHFFASSIKRVEKNPSNPSITIPGKCKTCAKEYGKNYRDYLIKKKLTRKNKPQCVKYNTQGLLYIIGTTPNNPVKIGITSGTSMKRRLPGLQTSHWLELKILFQSDVIQNLREVETELHNTYKQYNIRGEWFDIPEKKLKQLTSILSKKFRK